MISVGAFPFNPQQQDPINNPPERLASEEILLVGQHMVIVMVRKQDVLLASVGHAGLDVGSFSQKIIHERSVLWLRFEMKIVTSVQVKVITAFYLHV